MSDIDTDGSAAAEAIASPSVVALVSHSTPAHDLVGGFRCAGVLVGPTVVLTAKHCIEGMSAARLDVVIDPVDLCDPTSDADERVPAGAIRPLPDADLAEIVIGRPVAVEPAAVATRRPSQDDRLLAVGWGQRSSSGPCRRSAVALALASETDCATARSHLRPEARRWQLCALPLEGGRNTCTGDSGGPLFAVTGSVPRLVGITSAGMGGCGPTDLGLYVRVDCEIRGPCGEARPPRPPSVRRPDA
ncbi:S1 family peptidase [Pimelobacter simplex]|uniref:S1 family peptidase n=1 Tax=Nocardioides simplex TaxID=2045 RepID=UPI0037FD4AF1